MVSFHHIKSKNIDALQSVYPLTRFTLYSKMVSTTENFFTVFCMSLNRALATRDIIITYVLLVW